MSPPFLGFGDNASKHSALSWRRLIFRQTTIRSASGTNSLHSRITSGVQRSAALAAWAQAGVTSAVTSKPTTSQIAAQSRGRARIHDDFFIRYPPDELWNGVDDSNRPGVREDAGIRER